MTSVLDAIKLPEEDEIRERLESHPFYAKELKALLPDEPNDGYDTNLRAYLREGAELTASSYEALHGLMRNSAERLGMGELASKVRLFKTREPGGTENALVSSSKEAVLVAFSNGILTSIDDHAVMASILGHELAHHGYRHTLDVAMSTVATIESCVDAMQGGVKFDRQAKKQLTRIAREREYDEVVALAMLLSQLCELNCDRAGVICCGALSPSVQASMVLSAGPADSFGNYDVEDYLKQAQELLGRDDTFDDEDVFRTHPLEPLRVHALEFFTKSDVFRDITGEGPATTKLAEFGALLPRVVPVEGILGTKKTPPTKGTSPQKGAAPQPGELDEVELGLLRFLLMTEVAQADGKVTPAEEDFIWRQIRPTAVRDAVLAKLDEVGDADLAGAFPDIYERAPDLSARMKTALIKQLIQLAKADRRISDDEIRKIRRIAEGLGAGTGANEQMKNAWGDRVG